MTDLDPTIRRLIVTHALAGTDPEADIALFFSVPEDKRGVLIERLKVIDRFLGLERAGLEQADEAAAELKMTRRNFYRLVARKNELGGVRGLTPRFRTNQAAYPVLTGLTPVAEQVVRNFVADPTNLSVADLEEMIIRKAEAAGEKAPSAGSIRRRIETLRREGYAMSDDPILGRQLVIDQVVVDLPVKYPDRIDKPVATFIICRQTLLILGGALARPDEVGAGLLRAITDLHLKRMAEVTEYSPVRLAKRIEMIDWVVDVGLDGRVAQVKRDVFNWTASTINIHTGNNRRAGALVRKLIGDGIGTLPFVLRTKRNNLEEAAAVAPKIADNILSSQISVWNLQILDRLAQSGSQPSSDTVDLADNILTETFYAVGGIVGGKVKPLISEVVSRAAENGEME